MSKVKFNESTIGEMYQTNLVGIEYNWYVPNTHLLFESIFISVSEFLGASKGVNKSVGIKIDNTRMEFIIGAMVTYHANEDDAEMPGNYTYEWSIDESDFEGLDSVVRYVDPQFMRMFVHYAGKHAGIAFNKDEYAAPLIEYAAKTLMQWLDANALENEEVSLELDGYFVATVAVENGEKVFSIVPDGAMKRLIKDDESIQAA